MKEDARWGKRPGREGQIEELVGGQNPGPEAPPRSKKGQKRREQRRCQERSDCQWSNVEGWMSQVIPTLFLKLFKVSNTNFALRLNELHYGIGFAQFILCICTV